MRVLHTGSRRGTRRADRGYGSGMARTTVAWLGAALLVASCSGSDASGETTAPSTDSPTTVTTSNDDETNTTSSTTTTTTTSTATTTTTQPPPTTISDDELAAEVEAAYFAAYDAYHTAILDPGDEDLRRQVRATYTAQALERVDSFLDRMVESKWIARPNPSVEASAVITGAVEFENGDRTLASIVACEINPEWFFELDSGPNGEEALLRDTVFRVDVAIEFELTEEGWKNAGGGEAVETAGVESCDQ